MFELLAALAVGYLVGSVPSAALVARARGRDIFEVGSGNPGAMNTARNLGWALGTLVFALDVGKGLAAVALALGMAALSGAGPDATLAMALVAGVGAVAGHAWSAYAGLRGGKALATMFGVALPIYPIGALYTLGVLVAMVLIVRRTTLASVITLFLYPLIVLAALARGGWTQGDAFAVFTGVILLSLISLVKHLPDLRRDRRLF